ncbi:MAG: choice-of-anchor D domain-containing protein [Candidatus Kapaibacterium sp.]
MSIRYFLLSLLLLIPLSALFAGGPISAVSGNPTTWDIKGSGPIALYLDRGPLGQFDSATAYSIVEQSILAWDSVEGSYLQMIIAGSLDHNVTSATDPLISGISSVTDGIVPVIYDDDGSITDARLGVGAKNSVLGFAGGYSSDGRTFTDGSAVINGSRSNSGENRYVTTITHELGHLIGLSHTQQALLVYRTRPSMYPAGGTFAEDDRRALIRLYPTESALNGLGTISGKVLNPDGSPVSGVNVVVVDSVTGAVYSTLTDYFSGNSPRFIGGVPKSGEYRLEALPPGTYFVRIEGLRPDWKSGSSVGSYDPPINTEVIRDWYNGGGESGAMLLDNINQRTSIKVEANKETGDIDLVQNDTTGLFSLLGITGRSTASYGVPETYQGVRALAFARRFVAPESGAPALVRVRVDFGPSLNANGEVVLSLYRNQRFSGKDLPGSLIGSVSVPQSHITAFLDNDIWLHSLSPSASFAKGEVFHVGIALSGPGRLDLVFDDTQEGSETTYLRGSDSTWNSFPWEGNNGGMRKGELEMSLFYSSVPTGARRILANINPNPLQFDSVEVGEVVTDSVFLSSIGTEPLQLNEVAITGANKESFSLADPTLLPLTISPGTGRFVVVNFAPNAEGGQSAELQLKGNVTVSLPLSGKGIPSIVQSLLTTIDFGQQVIGTTRQIDTAVIYNRGTQPLVLKGEEGGGGGGITLVKPTKTTILGAGASLNVVVEFNPTQVGDFQNRVDLVFSPARDTIRIDVTGRGVLEISDVPDVLLGGTDGVVLESIWPNPVRDQIEVVLNYSGEKRLPVTLMVVDVAGRVVYRKEETLVASSGGDLHRVIDLRSLPSGLYHVLLQTPKEQTSRGILLVR